MIHFWTDMTTFKVLSIALFSSCIFTALSSLLPGFAPSLAIPQGKFQFISFPHSTQSYLYDITPSDNFYCIYVPNPQNYAVYYQNVESCATDKVIHHWPTHLRLGYMTCLGQRNVHRRDVYCVCVETSLALSGWAARASATKTCLRGAALSDWTLEKSLSPFCSKTDNCVHCEPLGFWGVVVIPQAWLICKILARQFFLEIFQTCQL